MDLFNHNYYHQEGNVDLTQFPPANFLSDDPFVDFFQSADLIKPVNRPVEQEVPKVQEVPEKPIKLEAFEPVPEQKASVSPIASDVVKSEPVDLATLLSKASKRGRKRKSSEEKNEGDPELTEEMDEYRRKRLRNNIAVRKSRERAKLRQEDTQQKLIELANENAQQQALINTVKKDLTSLEEKHARVQTRLEDTLRLNVRLRQFIANLPAEWQPQFSF